MRALIQLLLVLLTTISSSNLRAEFLAGVGQAHITPPPGWRMSGYFNERFNTGTHDPLFAKVMFFNDGETKSALIFCDLMGVPASVTMKARELIQTELGIPVPNIVIAATHSHTGPLFFDALHDYLHQRAMVKDGSDTHEPIDYSAFLIRRIADAATAAAQSAKPSQVGVVKSMEWSLSFNRRFHMKNGTVVFNPGKMNTNIVGAAGPVDPDLMALVLRRSGNEKPFSALTVFALHLDTTGGTEYSADYPLYMEKVLQERLGAGFTSIFGAGTCGDINHIDAFSPRQQKGGEEARRIGEKLGGRMSDLLSKAIWIQEPRLRAASEKTNAPLQDVSASQLEQARSRMSKVGTPELPFLDQVEAYKFLNVHQMREAAGQNWNVEVQAIRLSADTALVALPGEVFVDLGLAIKRLSPFPNTLVIELANDYVGYVPTLGAFAQGSYETVNSRLKPGSGEMMAGTAVRLLQQLAR
jgi:neutral ceramidase